MRFVALLGLVTLCFTACASVPRGPVDPIIGDWNGVGFLATFHAKFGSDHSYRLTDSMGGGKTEEFAAGIWTYLDGKYTLPNKDGDRSAQIDQSGQLIITAVVDPSVRLVMQRPGAQPLSAINPGKRPSGEWRFTYTSKASVPAASPPPFDVMDFTDRSKVRLRNSMASKDFALAYKVKGSVISISTGDARLPTLDLAYRWEDGGNRLLLSLPEAQNGPFEFEWTFMQPDQFLSYNLDGTWVSESKQGGLTQEVEFGKDGRWTHSAIDSAGRTVDRNNKLRYDFYRLWNAPFGNAVTIVVYDPEMNLQITLLFRYEKTADRLVLTPVELQPEGKFKVHDDDPQAWMLKKAP